MHSRGVFDQGIENGAEHHRPVTPRAISSRPHPFPPVRSLVARALRHELAKLSQDPCPLVTQPLRLELSPTPMSSSKARAHQPGRAGAEWR